MKKYIHILVMSLLCVCAQNVSAEVTVPLYTFDYKPQVFFGDSGAPINNYQGLENYTADYKNGFLHISYSLTHDQTGFASYPPFLFIRSTDPTTNIGTTLYRSLIQTVPAGTTYSTDVYFVDIQFSFSGYRKIVTQGITHNPFSDDFVSIDGMNGNTFISLANDYPLSSPPSPYSMAFQPLRLTEFPPTHLISFAISTSTKTATLHVYVSPSDAGIVSLRFNIGSTSSNQTLLHIYDGESVPNTNAGDITHSWIYPTLVTSSLPGFNPYIFSSDIVDASTTIMESTSTVVAITEPKNDYAGYFNTVVTASQPVQSSYDSFTQTLGTGLSGTMNQIDIETSNSSRNYYGSRPWINLYECDDSTYGGGITFQAGCRMLYSALSDMDSKAGTSTQSFFPDPITFNPSKYYAFATQGNAQFNVLSTYYGSTADTVDGACFERIISPNDPPIPCRNMADLYFYLYGVTKTVQQPTGNSSVLFLPGLEGSRLYLQTPAKCPFNCEDQLWEPNTNSDATDLNMDPTGTSSTPNIYTRDIIKTTNTPFSFAPISQDIYKSFSDTMDSLVATTSSKRIAGWKAYAYDWRYSVDTIINNGTQYQNGRVSLIQTLQNLVASSTNGKVTIVAHSNGGLLAKALLIKLQAMKTAGTSNLIDHIDTVILVAVPQIGTASAVPAMLHGFDQQIVGGWILDQQHARELGRNSPAGFGLLPSKEYINHISASPITFVDNPIPSGVTTPFVTSYGNVIDSYSKYKSFLLGSEGRIQPPNTDTISPIKLSPTLFNNAETLHNTLDSWVAPASIRVIQIAGWGLDTVASFQYYPKYDCNGSAAGVSPCKYILDERPVFTADGDKVAVSPSALWMGGERYYLNISRYNNDKPPFGTVNSHKDILQITPLLNFISNIVQGIPPSPSVYLSTTSPVDTLSRLRLSVLSPVTLDAYDTQGNHTGKICPPTTDLCYTEENIPNSGYYEFGEGKYLNIPQGAIQKVSLQGTDAGTFTFNFQIVSPNGQATTSSFTDIPVTTQTQADITLNPVVTQVPQLALDVTGDGVTDFTLTPNTTFDPIIYLQIMKATVDSLDLTPAKINAFDTRITNIIKLIQKGKIDKAKLKVGNFKNVLENKLSKPDIKKPRVRKLSKTDAQTLLDMLNTLLDNLN